MNNIASHAAATENLPRSSHPALQEDPRLVQVLEEYRALLEAGHKPERHQYLERFPELSASLNDCFDSLEFVFTAGPDLNAAAGQAASAATPSQLAGSIPLGDYRVVREIGRGGMGVVYEAEQMLLGRRVALKVLPFAATLDARQLQRFQNEARAAACLHHPHIVPVYAVGCERGVHYYAMQFIEGQSLGEVIADLRLQNADSPAGAGGRDKRAAGRLPSIGQSKICNPQSARADTPPNARLSTELSQRGTGYFRTVAQLGIEAAEALQHAHELGVIHRDVKPANLLVDARGNLWVTDFGLAQIHGENQLTLSGDLVGTLRYMSPEQALAKRVLVDQRTDIYSLGATLYELLTLEPIFAGGDRQELLRQIAFEEPRSARRHNKAIPPELETIISKALEKNPTDRYATAQDLADDLRRFLEDKPIRARPPRLAQRCSKWVRRRPALAAAYGLAVLALFLGGVGGESAWLWRRAEVARADAAQALEKEQKARHEEAIAQRRWVAASNLLRVNMAERAWLDKDVVRARALLASCPPELRRWEWQYVNRLCHPELLTLPVRLEEGAATTLSLDGKLLASACKNKSVKVWDLATGKVILTLQGHSNTVQCLAFSPDQKRLASGSPHGSWNKKERKFLSGEIRIWDLATGQEVRAVQERGGVISSVAFSADARRVAGISEDRTLNVWEVATGQVTFSLRGQEDGVENIAFSPDGKLLAGASSHRVRVINLATRHEVRTFQGAGGWGNRLLVFSPDSKNLACGARDGTGVQVWDLTTGAVLLLANTREITSMAFSPDGQRLATASSDSTIKVWDFAVGRKAITVRRILTGGRVRVAFSPDGKNLASTSNRDNSVWVSDPASGELIFFLTGHTTGVSCVGYSTDGTRLAAASFGMVKVWDMATRKDAFTLPVPGEQFCGVALSPDGRRLATISLGKDNGKVWDLTTGQEVLALRGHIDALQSVAYSPDGKYVATCSRDRTVKVWDAASGQGERTLAGHDGMVTCVAFSPDGKRLASASWDRTVKVWDLATGQALHTLRGHALSVEGVAFSANGWRLASGSSDQTVKLWDVATGKELLTLYGAGEGVAFSHDGRRLASSGSDAIRVWDLVTMDEAVPLQGHSGPVSGVAFSADGWRLASVSADQTVKVWDMTRVPGPRTLRVLPEACKGNGALSPDGTHFASSNSLDPTVLVWDLASGQELLRFKAHEPVIRGAVWCVAYSPDGKYLASASHDKTAKVWDLSTVRAPSQGLLTLEGHTAGVKCVVYSPDGKRLATGSMMPDYTVRVWEAATGQETFTLRGHTSEITSVAFSRDGKLLASGSEDKTVKVWDTETGQELHTFKGHTGGVWCLAFSPDGKRVASSSRDQTIKVWDLASGEEVLTLKGHYAQVLHVTFSPDGQRLASGSLNGAIKLWDSTTGEETLTLKGHTDKVRFLAFTPDGRRLVSASEDHTIKIWDATPQQD